MLQERLVETVLVCGVRTEVCVEATAKRAFAEGFRTVIVTDCTESYDDQGALNDEIFRRFDGYFGYALSKEEVLERVR